MFDVKYDVILNSFGPETEGRIISRTGGGMDTRRLNSHPPPLVTCCIGGTLQSHTHVCTRVIEGI